MGPPELRSKIPIIEEVKHKKTIWEEYVLIGNITNENVIRVKMTDEIVSDSFYIDPVHKICTDKKESGHSQ